MMYSFTCLDHSKIDLLTDQPCADWDINLYVTEGRQTARSSSCVPLPSIKSIIDSHESFTMHSMFVFHVS